MSQYIPTELKNLDSIKDENLEYPINGSYIPSNIPKNISKLADIKKYNNNISPILILDTVMTTDIIIKDKTSGICANLNTVGKTLTIDYDSTVVAL